MQEEQIKINDQFSYFPDQKLGSGTFGVVYKGIDLKQNKIIAVKQLNKNYYDKWVRQKQVMEKLALIKHPNIVQYFGHSEKEQGAFFFLQYCSGGTLQKLIKGKISELKAVDLFRQILSALNYINKKKIVHRDVKPQNILLDEYNNIKLVDYGLAREIDTTMTKRVGSPLYQAPQVIFRKQYDERCDVWSVGLILYYILMRKQYFSEAKNLDQLKELIKSMEDGNKKVKYPQKYQPEWQQITNLMLIYDFKLRPTIQNVMDKFTQIEGNLIKKIKKKLLQQSSEDQQMYQNMLRRTNKINPYRQNSLRQTQMIKLREEQSYRNIQNVRRYLRYFQLKNQLLTKLGYSFKQSKFQDFANIYKYLLIFLALSTYIIRVKKHIAQLNNIKVNTPDKSLTIHNFIQKHHDQFQETRKEFIKYHEKNVSKYIRVIKKQIAKPILEKYLHREYQKGVIATLEMKFGNIVDMIKSQQWGQHQNQQQFFHLYKCYIGIPEIHLSLNKIQQLDQKKKRTYALIRIIGKIDEFFEDKMYQNDDYVNIKQQQIFSESVQSLLKLIEKYNQ